MVKLSHMPHCFFLPLFFIGLNRPMKMLQKLHKITLLFKDLRSDQYNASSFKDSRERDMALSLSSAQEWERICGNSKEMSRDIRIRLIQFKILKSILLELPTVSLPDLILTCIVVGRRILMRGWKTPGLVY